MPQLGLADRQAARLIASLRKIGVPRAQIPSDPQPGAGGRCLAIWVLGLGLAVWARIYLGRNWGMPTSTKEDPELVTSGPYRTIRHPIYTGILLAMIGSAIAVTV